MNRAQEARSLATAAFKVVLKRDPSLSEVQFLQAVGALETSYGYGWKEPQAKGSNNIGAIIAGASWRGDTFEHRDSKPVEGSNESSWYTIAFRKYPTPQAGWEDLADIMYRRRPEVLAAASEGDSYGVSAAMYHSTYYRGTGPDAATRIGRHNAALNRHLATQTREMNETQPATVNAPERVLLLKAPRMIGEDVKEVQRLLGDDVVADGVFGQATQAAVIEFQTKHGLKPDGAVGPITKAKLITIALAERLERAVAVFNEPNTSS